MNEVTLILSIVGSVALFVIYHLIEYYKSYNLDKPNLLPVALQICVVLLIPAFIINIVTILLFDQVLI